jgi:hypothetical protein
MAATGAAGSDGFNQLFGLNAVAGDHGSKQGWSDPGWEPYNIHSVGWTGQYFVAILQTTYSASSATMRETSTYSATLITEAMLAATRPIPAGPSALCDPPAGWLTAAMFALVVDALTVVLPATRGSWCPAA